MKGKTGSLDKKIVRERVVNVGDRLGETSVYYKCGHMLDAPMGSMSKSLIDK